MFGAFSFCFLVVVFLLQSCSLKLCDRSNGCFTKIIPRVVGFAAQSSLSVQVVRFFSLFDCPSTFVGLSKSFAATITLRTFTSQSDLPLSHVVYSSLACLSVHFSRSLSSPFLYWAYVMMSKLGSFPRLAPLFAHHRGMI